jgi:hypothetical protein
MALPCGLAPAVFYTLSALVLLYFVSLPALLIAVPLGFLVWLAWHGIGEAEFVVPPPAEGGAKSHVDHFIEDCEHLRV